MEWSRRGENMTGGEESGPDEGRQTVNQGN